MTQLWHSSLSSPVRTAQPEDHTNPLQGYGIRWKTLTRAEQVVCASIVLIPFWWILGWNWMLSVVVVGTAIHDIFRHGSIHLKRPTLETGALLTFGFYILVNASLKTTAFVPSALLTPINSWICAGLALWYLQSNDIRVRPKVAAWALSVSIIQMVVFWLVVHFVLSDPHYVPPRTIFGFLTDKGEKFISGAGNANFLKPYDPGEKGLGGLARYNFFFAHAAPCVLVVGFAALLSLDMKNQLWARYMISGCFLLLFLSQTRSAWISLPLILGIRYFSTRSKASLFAIISVISLTVLSFPPVTDALFGNYSGAIEATSNFRKDSSEVRSLIYQRTLERIPEELLLGHGINGPTVLPGFEGGRIGSHSFFLGTLLYKSGLVGTAIFTTFLSSLLLWLARTRANRPRCCFLVLLYIGLNLLVEEPEIVTILLVLLCTLVREHEIIPPRGLRNA
jgi:O-Antigen ligase